MYEESQAERLDVPVDLVLVRHTAKRIENFIKCAIIFGFGGQPDPPQTMSSLSNRMFL